MCPKYIRIHCIFAMLFLSCTLCCSCTLSVPSSFSDSGTSAASDQTLPWEPDLQNVAPTYDVYFSETIDYRTTDWLYSDDSPTDRMNVWPQSEYSVRYYDGTLYLLEAAHQSEPVIHLSSPVDLGTDFIVAGCDDQYVYGIVSGTDLVRVDYFGREMEVLFSDPSGKISAFSESGADFFSGFENRTYRYATRIQMADAKVLFFAAGSTGGDGCSIYRMYLPTGTVDELVTDLPDTFTFLVPVSNHEILWQIENEEFFTRFHEAYSDPDTIYGSAQDEHSAMIAFEKDFKIYPYTHFYFNDLTKASVSVPVSSSYHVIAPYENKEERQQAGNDWWRGSNVTASSSQVGSTMPEPFDTACKDHNVYFYQPCNDKLDSIPVSLIEQVGVDEFEAWANSLPSQQYELPPTSLLEYENLYSFTQYFHVPDRVVRDTLEQINKRLSRLPDEMTPEEIAILVEGTPEELLAAFASPYTIVHNGIFYTPQWVYYHSVEEYDEAGITKEEIEQRIGCYGMFAFTEDAAQAFERKLSAFVGYTVDF